uniref:Ras-related protein Rab-18 n=1 Tax=Arcella intermedia TaxID=1963864 RepID=A0A6B2LIK8_9EUKA
MLRFTEGQFDVNQAATIGVDFKIHLMDVKDNLKVNLTIWDTAGQEKFQSLTGSYYRGAHAIFIVYDVTNSTSFLHLKKWLEEIDTYTTSTDVIKLLIGNKIDDKEKIQVTRAQGMEFANAHNLMFAELSAKDDIGVDLAFEQMINAVLDNPNLLKATSTKKPKENITVNQSQSDPQNQNSQLCYC